jgi:hypothetical protein
VFEVLAQVRSCEMSPGAATVIRDPKLLNHARLFSVAWYAVGPHQDGARILDGVARVV